MSNIHMNFIESYKVRAPFDLLPQIWKLVHRLAVFTQISISIPQKMGN